MTHQNHQTNGASLEDCHTNFFALTELFGIKWRKLVWERESSGGGGGGEGEEGAAPLADPVISSYARCLAGDILCVWRRVPAHQPPDLYDMPAPPPLSLRAAKELWIFWYGEEPDLNGLVAPELIASQGDQGSWESGLSYECRSLLFKALHNLIERCLLSRDFVRLGKWFVQPYDGDEEDVGKSPWHLSFSFAFFLHGESTVCASVDVRQHPPVRTLTAKRLARLAAADQRDRAKVILAPFGLEGRVTGREWSDGDPATARLLDAWRQLYPLEHGCGAVEVECGGVRMRYPLPYALLTEMEAPSSGAPAAAAAALARRALRSLTTPRPHQTPELCYGDTSGDKCEDFLDPTRKTPCTCAKASGGACSPGSCGASPAAAVSAPSSAGAPPPSPHPHPLHAALPQHQSGGAVPTTLHTPAPTPDPHAPPTPAPPSAPPHKHYPQGDSPSYAGNGNGNGTGAATGSELLRRPVLPPAEQRLDPLEDEHSLHMLYDYTTVHAWLEHPVKRFKAEARGGEWGECGEWGETGERREWREWRECREWSGWSEWGERLALGARAADLYAGLPHTPPPAPQPAPPPPADLKQERNDDDVKEYKNLFTSDGLCPTLKDLDQIFDNSDDAASGDETMALAVGAGAGAGAGGEAARCEEARCGGRCVRAEELSKMFPTPPSMEAHAQPSPGFSLPDDATPQPHVHRHLLPGSPPPDPIEDWSYVFKPPTVYKYVGSSKYAALSTLPSQLLPAVTLPPHAVYRPRWQHDAKRDPDPDPDTHTHPPRPGTANSTNNSNSRGLKRPVSPSTDTRPASVAGAGAGVGAGAVAAGVVAGAGAGAGSPRLQRSPASPGSVASPQPPAAACPLLLNVLLTDTVLNVFRDHNFDSCTLCVCDTEVGNIRGADAAAYLAHGEAAPEHESVRCSCGFSAIVNRRLAHRAGLFYEDEVEITGRAVEATEAAEAAEAEEAGARGAGGGRGAALAEVAGVLAAQCAAPAGGPASALARAAARPPPAPPADHLRLNLLEYSDGGAAAACALREASTSGSAALAGSSPAGTGSTGNTGTTGTVHRWPFIGARAPRSSRDVVRLMRRLRPLLQDAIQKRCCGARMWDGVTGPLTWRQFHRLAGRGNEDLCEPQPVPPLLVGHDRDWISLSPYALRHWERLSLEPYSYARDVAFVALAADGEALTDPLRTFFRELSTAYEACRLGRHQPITRIARDGIVRTPPAERCDTDEWAGELPPGRLGEYVRAYADALRELVAQLSPMTIDRTLFEGEKATGMRPPVAPERPATPGGSAGAGGRGGPRGAGAVPGGAARRARAPRARAAGAAAPRRAGAPPPAAPQPIHKDNLARGSAGVRRHRAAHTGLQRVQRRAAPAAAPAQRQVTHRLRHRCQRKPLPQFQRREEPRGVPAILAGVGAGAAARAQGGGGDVGAGVRRPVLRAVRGLLPVARPALAAGRRHRRARRAARHRRHQHTRACTVAAAAGGARGPGAAAGPHQADGLHAGRHVAGRAALAPRRRPRRPHRARRAQRVELPAVAQEPGARVGRAARRVRQLRGAVPGRRALRAVGLPRVHRARPLPAPHGRPLHPRRALLAGLHPLAPAHAARRHRHPHTRLPHLRHHAVEPDAVRAAERERRGQRHHVPGRGHGGRGHGRGQHGGAADRRHVHAHVGAGQPARVAAPPRRRGGRQPRRQPGAPPPPAPGRRLPRRRRPPAGADRHDAAAAAGAGLPGVDGAAGRHAGVVVGGLRAPARRLPRLPQERAAPALGQRAGRRRLHLAHAAPRPQLAPARLADHHRRAQVRLGGVQRAVVAGAGRNHERPAVLPAAARAGAHAALPHGCGAWLVRVTCLVCYLPHLPHLLPSSVV